MQLQATFCCWSFGAEDEVVGSLRLYARHEPFCKYGLPADTGLRLSEAVEAQDLLIGELQNLQGIETGLGFRVQPGVYGFRLLPGC